MVAPISLTNKAADKVKELIISQKKYALRLDLKKGGCAGMEYSMQYVDAAAENEEVVEFDGARIIVAPLAQMYLFGTTIDYEDGLLESGFKFNNPNVSEACGCGESIKF
jgi:iron-sulfur cluster assembly protein